LSRSFKNCWVISRRLIEGSSIVSEVCNKKVIIWPRVNDFRQSLIGNRPWSKTLNSFWLLSPKTKVMVWFRKKVTFYVFSFRFFTKASCLKVPHKGVSSHLFRKLIWKELSRMKLDFRGPADDWAAHLLLIFAHLYLINSQSWTNQRTNERTFRSQFFFIFFSSTMLRQKLWLLP